MILYLGPNIMEKWFKDKVISEKYASIGLLNNPESPTLIYVTHQIEKILPIFKHTLLMRRGEIHSSGLTSKILTEENLSNFFKTPVECHKENNRHSLKVSL